MRLSLLNLLVCPHCQRELKLGVSREEEGEIDTGSLTCEPCNKTYPIVRGIPRFVAEEGYAGSFGHQWNKYARLQLDSQNGTTFSRERFYSITEWSPAELKGNLILDSGCGAGRFCEVALEAGAEVVAVDLSSAVDACRANLKRFPNLHCVQASIYELPFRDGTFDFAFSIGVIQHTPDPRAAVDQIITKARSGGKLGFWIYELSWKSFIGTVGFKYALRPITRNLSTARLEEFSGLLERACWPINRFARGHGVAGKIIMRLLPVSCAHLQAIGLSEEDFREWVRLDTFDMYSPKYDKPQRYATVKAWMESAGCMVGRRHPHGGVSITGEKGSCSKAV
jgi:SAM-dependent methyltransferase